MEIAVRAKAIHMKFRGQLLMSDEFWGWTPGVAVGPFRFGSNASDAMRQHRLRRLNPDCPEAFWETYEIPDAESLVMVEGNKIASVACWDHLWFHGYDIIGLGMDGVIALLGSFNQTEDHPFVNETQVFYYHGLGLTLFATDGKVKSATCGESQPEEWPAMSSP